VEALCLDRFHRTRSLRLLRDQYVQIGAQAYVRLCETFGSIRDCGFTVDEIMHADVTLIKRSLAEAPPPQRRQRASGDGSDGGSLAVGAPPQDDAMAEPPPPPPPPPARYPGAVHEHEPTSADEDDMYA
jgi:hypothetical protein